MSLLFSKDEILLVNRRLAALIGLNEAIVLQQIQYWLQKKSGGVEHGGRRWVFNSLERWQEQFPFWSQDTVKRALVALKARGLVLVKKLSDNGLNRTNYYTIDYQQIALLEASNLHQSMGANCPDRTEQIAPIDQGKMPRPSGQIAPTIGANCTDDYIETKTTTKTTTKNKSAAAPSAPTIPGVPEELVSEWKAVRKEKRAGPISKTVIEALQREALKADYTLEAAVRCCVERGWQGFKADWVIASTPMGSARPRQAPQPKYGAAAKAIYEGVDL